MPLSGSVRLTSVAEYFIALGTSFTLANVLKLIGQTMIERDKASDNEQETYASRRSPFSKISKSNLFYIMVIFYLGITMAFVLSIKFTPEERFTEYLGNAATSISIVLALIAIFYSLYLFTGRDAKLHHSSCFSKTIHSVDLKATCIERIRDLARETASRHRGDGQSMPSPGRARSLVRVAAGWW